MTLKKRLLSVAIAVATAALNWLIFWKIANLFPSIKNSLFIANILIVAIIVHELGHFIVLEASGIRTHLIFAVIFGGAISSKRQLNQLPWSRCALMSLAGVMGNALLVISSIILYLVGILTSTQLSQIVNLNGALILWNLMPLWILDGGRFAKVIFDSLPEGRDTAYVYKIWIPFSIVALIAGALSGHLFLINAFLIQIGLHRRADYDDPKGSTDPQAITENQVKKLTNLYLGLLTSAVVMLAITRSWIR